MVALLIAALAFLFLSVAIHRHRSQLRKQERSVLKRIADNHLEPHKIF